MFPAKPANALAGGVLSAASMSVSARSRPRDKVRGYVLRHGGFQEGLTHAGGFVCVGHCEIDKYANRSYNALFDTEGEWYIEDARKADPSIMPDFQLLCGGFPCQSFSIAGSRKGFGDPRGTLFFELARLAEARKPPYLLFENKPYVELNIRP